MRLYLLELGQIDMDRRVIMPPTRRASGLCSHTGLPDPRMADAKILVTRDATHRARRSQDVGPI